MGSDDKKEVGHQVEASHADLANLRGTLPDKYDLDKNPVKYRQVDGGLSENAHDKDYLELTLRSGKHSDLVKKLMRQRIEQRAQDYPRWPGSLSNGVRVMWLESRFWYDRERLLPDFDEDWRKYRSRYLHSLELDPREPVHVPEYERMLINPIRRFYMKGGDFIEKHFVKRFITAHPVESPTYRVTITRFFMLYLACIGGAYYLRYGTFHWEKMRGFGLHRSAPIMYPDHPDYPYKDVRTEGAHHYDTIMGFARRTIYKDLRDFDDDQTTVL